MQFLMKYLDISNFDNSSITNLAFMFQSCASLESLNISNFNTSLVEDGCEFFRIFINFKF